MGKHRKLTSTSKKLAALGAAAVTTTALTVAVTPDPAADQKHDEMLRLLADLRPFGDDPQDIPDLTGGLGSQAYDLTEGAAAQLLSLTNSSGSAATFPDIPGVSLITTGPLFGLLNVFGVNYGYVPALPSSIADEIEGAPFVTANFPGIGSFLTATQEALVRAALTPILLAAGVPLREINSKINEILGPIPNIANVRVVPVLGVGLGALAAGQAYQQVADDWPTQPDPDNNALLGSVTILPMILVFNPGRANGGVLARAYPLFGLFGINTVTPDTEVQSTGGTPIKIGDIDTGLSAGGNNLIPIKLDVGIQNFPASDFAAWPNPVTLANNGAALLFPTYILRGFDQDAVESSLEQQLENQLPGVEPTADKPLSFNFYLTVPINGAPVLEPTYLAVDALNLVTGGDFNNPIGTALNPVLTNAGNLGYTDTVRTDDGNYVRTFDDRVLLVPRPRLVKGARRPVQLVRLRGRDGDWPRLHGPRITERHCRTVESARGRYLLRRSRSRPVEHQRGPHRQCARLRTTDAGDRDDEFRPACCRVGPDGFGSVGSADAEHGR
jgi:hypothetical protein